MKLRSSDKRARSAAAAPPRSSLLARGQAALQPRRIPPPPPTNVLYDYHGHTFAFKPEHVKIFFAMFFENHFPSNQQYQKLARQTSEEETKIRKWFKNQRYRCTEWQDTLRLFHEEEKRERMLQDSDEETDEDDDDNNDQATYGNNRSPYTRVTKLLFTPVQLDILYESFISNQRPNNRQADLLAQQLVSTRVKVLKWFENQRSSKSKIRDVLQVYIDADDNNMNDVDSDIGEEEENEMEEEEDEEEEEEEEEDNGQFGRGNLIPTNYESSDEDGNSDEDESSDEEMNSEDSDENVGDIDSDIDEPVIGDLHSNNINVDENQNGYIAEIENDRMEEGASRPPSPENRVVWQMIEPEEDYSAEKTTWTELDQMILNTEHEICSKRFEVMGFDDSNDVLFNTLQASTDKSRQELQKA